MKRNEVQDLQELTPEELQQRLRDAQKELFNLRVQQSSGQLEKPGRIRTLRRDIARLHTVARQKAIQGSAKESA